MLWAKLLRCSYTMYKCVATVIATKYTCKFVVTGHCCQKKGCGLALIIDGNMKNHRNICCATAAGYTEYKGLNGKVQTGCLNTPAYKSSYCHLHKPTMSVQKGGDSECTKEKPVGLIVSKNETRKTAFYQVKTTCIYVSQSTYVRI